jgi:hypothetical protein
MKGFTTDSVHFRVAKDYTSQASESCLLYENNRTWKKVTFYPELCSIRQIFQGI